MADLSALELTAEPVEVDLDNYVDQTEFPPPAPEGVYTFSSEFQNSDKPFEAKDGFLVTNLQHFIIAPGDPLDGHRVSFDRISAKTFERQGVKVCGMADQLRAFGVVDRIKNMADYAIAIEAAVTAKTLWKGQTQWEAFCKDCNEKAKAEGKSSKEAGKLATIKGMSQFPTNAAGARIPEIECKHCGATLQARERINRRIPA